jgi:hypothetical protein
VPRPDAQPDPRPTTRRRCTAAIEDRHGQTGRRRIELADRVHDARAANPVKLALEARRPDRLQQSRPFARVKVRGEDLSGCAAVHRGAAIERIREADRVLLGLDDVQHDRLQPARRGQDRGLRHLSGQLLHHAARRLHEPLSERLLGGPTERHQPRPERHRTAVPALD